MKISDIRRKNIVHLASKHGRAKLAEMLDYQDTGYLNQLCNGSSNIGNRTASKIEQVFNLANGSFDQPMDGPLTQNENLTAAQLFQRQIAEKNPELAQHLANNPHLLSATVEIPLIEWGSIEQQLSSADAHQTGKEKADIEIAKEDTFAAKIKGNSMASPTLPTMPQGTSIIIQPLKNEESINNLIDQFVIAKVNEEITCRKLIREGGQYYLEPLNTKYELIALDAPQNNILAKVVDYTQRIEF